MNPFRPALMATAIALLFCSFQPVGAQEVDASEVTRAPGQYSYAVKFVCGFNRTNVGITQNGNAVGEATVKAGNYATDINIFNPIADNAVTKKILVLVKEGFPVGREPEFVGPSAEDFITLPICTATMDDCNRIAELLYPAGIPTPLPLTIGFLVLESKQELDVTAVYTSEICTDFVTVGGAAMCSSPPGAPGFASGAGISIDVEQITGRFIP